MTERTTVRLPHDLLDQAKRKASSEGRTLTSLIEDGLRRVVSDDRKSSVPARVMPPVSTARGGMLPGIDITRFSDIQAWDDLEYAERMRHQD